MSRRFDLIIFGASGFTGKYTVFEGVKLLSGLKWAIAGRSKDKLDAVLKEMGKKAETDLSHIPIVMADVKDLVSIKRMADQCKVLINCCGPYRFYGEPVVKACIEAGTHHVDVTGEPQYMEKMQLEYNNQAEEKGVYVVSACGFDSIPAEMGLMFTEEKFNGTLNSAEVYIKLLDRSKQLGSSTHYGTWESAIHIFTKTKELEEVRSKLFASDNLPDLAPKLEQKSVLHRSDLVRRRWCLPFHDIDRSVVDRTQRFLYKNNDKHRPIQFKEYLVSGSIFEALAVMFLASVFYVMTRCKCGINLLLNYPKLFSLGQVSHEGPSEMKMEKTTFEIIFHGKGWSDGAEISHKTTHEIVTKVTGTNPGYGATCVALLLSAKTILSEANKMPGSGGVIPPGAAFGKTSLIKQLTENGFTFEVVQSVRRPASG